MRYRSLMIIVVAILTAAFFALNWSVFAAPAKFSLLFASFETSVGAVLFVVFAIIIATLAIYMGLSQSALLLEYRRQAKELQTQRSLADNAEASRFTEMGALVHREIADVATRLESALAAMREEFRNTESSIAATLGEMDDRMQRMTGTSLPER